MKISKLALLILAAFIATRSTAQSVGVGINATGASAHSSAMLDVVSTDRGFLAPRMTTTQRDAISSPATGLLIYQTDGTAGFYYYSGSAWQPISGSSTGTGPWTVAGTDIYNNNTGNVGVGIATPAARLHVADSSVVFSGPATPWSVVAPAPTPVVGPGTRMMWYADKTAFRAGYVDADQWDETNIGYTSTAFGYNTIAIGDMSTAMGNYTTASGQSATAMGMNTTASGYNGATAMGWNTTASGGTATAMGVGTLASGEWSTAMGFGTIASGDRSTAIGSGTSASGEFANAMGYNTTASGFNSTAMSHHTIASGRHSIAMGERTTASGQNSFASGSYSTASGNNSTAMGIWTTASAGGAGGATAIGYGTIASGVYSTAMGTQVSTNGRTGAFAIGDKPPTTSSMTYNDADNQMMMRFAGGYKLYSDASATVGTQLAAGGNSWSTISDVRKKENFAPVNGEDFLNKISGFKLTSWNYKGQDPKQHRHYGPMAQDFYAAFGKDNYGTVGNDTTISQADMEGVSFVAIQALVKRTEELLNKNEKMQQEIDALKAENKTVTNQNNVLKAELADQNKTLITRMEMIEAELQKGKMSTK